MSVMVAEAVGVGVKVGLGVTVDVGEAVRVGEGVLEAVWLGVCVWVGRVADGLWRGACLAGALQPTSNHKRINKNGNRSCWLCREVYNGRLCLFRLSTAIQYHALFTVKKE